MTRKLNIDKAYNDTVDRRPAYNSVLPQLAVTYKIEAECSYQIFVQVDSEVLRNRQRRQHAKRFRQPYKTTVLTSTDRQETENLPTLRKIKRGASRHTKPTLLHHI
jgi:hypothetical protein